MPIEQPQNESTYVIDPESATETARLMHQDRLTRSWRRHYQSALSFADWRHDVDDSHAEIAVFCLESKPFVGILWPQIVERNAILRLLRIITVDALDLEQRPLHLSREYQADCRRAEREGVFAG